MFAISEWLPNPTGSDAEGEWIELVNTGRASDSLLGWSIQNGSGKRVVFRDRVVAPGEYVVLERGATKLSLRNQNESLSLFDPQKNLQSQVAYPGEAPEGKSLSVIGGHVVVGIPTPHKENARLTASLLQEVSPPSLTPRAQIGGVVGEGVFVACAISALVLFCFKEHETLSELFFSRYEEIG
jgi:hypothetical protein